MKFYFIEKTSMGCLFQRPTILLEKYLLTSNLNIRWQNLRPFPPALLLVTTEKRLTLSSLWSGFTHYSFFQYLHSLQPSASLVWQPSPMNPAYRRLREQPEELEIHSGLSRRARMAFPTAAVPQRTARWQRCRRARPRGQARGRGGNSFWASAPVRRAAGSEPLKQQPGFLHVEGLEDEPMRLWHRLYSALEICLAISMRIFFTLRKKNQNIPKPKPKRKKKNTTPNKTKL